MPREPDPVSSSRARNHRAQLGPPPRSGDPDAPGPTRTGEARPAPDACGGLRARRRDAAAAGRRSPALLVARRRRSPRCSARRAVARTERRHGAARLPPLLRRRSPRRSKLAIQHEEDLVVSGERLLHRQPARLARAVRPLGANRCARCSATRSCENIGLVALVPASRPDGLRSAASPPTRSNRSAPTRAPRPDAFEILPPGTRPYYCFAVAGLVAQPRDLPARAASTSARSRHGL